MKIIDGKAFAQKLIESMAGEVKQLVDQHKIQPGLAVILAGEDPASKVYVANKQKQALSCGMNSWEYKLAETATQAELIALIQRLNQDVEVNGILVQLPLPAHIDANKVLHEILPAKDVDGFHPVNVGKLSIGDKKALIPCTPLGCSLLLKAHVDNLIGKHAVIVGRSNIVGKPMAQLLLAENMTVTIVHSKSQNIEAICAQADVVIAAVGQAKLVKKSWLKEQAVVIDVGINRIMIDDKAKLVGDVDFEDVQDKVSFITPVPGGVGPMTIACLLKNTLTACKQQNQLI